jgi:mannitol/fructose-specific phosphotransferase system IIA component (Ntr-type)
MDMAGKTRDEVFVELVETIAGTHPEFDRQEMMDALVAREKRMNTAILPGVAIPHGYCSGVDGIIGAVGFSRKGIDYDCPDPVHAVFMLLMDGSFQEAHLQILGRLLELFNSDSFATMLAAKTSREAHEALRQF